MIKSISSLTRDARTNYRRHTVKKAKKEHPHLPDKKFYSTSEITESGHIVTIEEPTDVENRDTPINHGSFMKRRKAVHWNTTRVKNLMNSANKHGLNYFRISKELDINEKSVKNKLRKEFYKKNK
eukprot:GAHX01000273.1.p1 GENE.GAHX01000273.1~~GAHX01000273.1.p1  ORF type:complete len:125 (+),score=26.23 GAHX01000273.1:47-421(+)